MEKEYKQWKRFFANKYVILLMFLAVFFLSTVVLNLLLHLVGILFSYAKLFIHSASQGEDVPQFPQFDWNWFFNFQSHYWWLYLGMYVILTIFLSIRAYEMRMSFQDINKGTKGTARWTKLEEVQEQYKAVKDDDQQYNGKSGSPVFHYNGQVYVDTNNTNSLIVASTQSGKTEMYSYPYLDLKMRAKEKDSVIVTDVKGDMLKNTRADFEKYGYLVKVLNLIAPYWGIGYNPLELIKQAYLKEDYAKAQKLCNTLSYSLFHNPNAKEPIWEESSIALVNALILAVCDLCIKANKPENVTMYTLTVMLNELASNPDKDGITKLDRFFASLDVNNPAKLQYGTIQFSQGITRSGIYTGTMAKLKNYLSDNIARMTAANDLNLEDLAYGEKPIALFIVYPDWDDSNYTIISTFLSQINAVLSEKATLSKSTKLPRRVCYLLEEVANIPAIDGLSRAMNVGLSRNIVYSLVVQSTPQLVEKYGEDLTKAIIGACGNQYYIMSDEMSDAEDFSEKIGVKTVIAPSRQGEPMSLEKSFNEQEEERHLMLSDELKRLRKGEWVLVRSKNREDLKGDRVVPYPIFASLDQGSQMLHRYEYLLHRFNHEVAFKDMGIHGQHEHIDLNSLLITLDAKEQIKDLSKEELTEKVKTATQKDKGEDLAMSEIEDVKETNTPINDVLSMDKYLFIKNLILENETSESYEYFCALTTIEELKTFLSQAEKRYLYDKVHHFFEKTS